MLDYTTNRRSAVGLCGKPAEPLFRLLAALGDHRRIPGRTSGRERQPTRLGQGRHIARCQREHLVVRGEVRAHPAASGLECGAPALNDMMASQLAALMLPDGRVLTGGGGLCGGCSVNHPNTETFSPRSP